MKYIRFALCMMAAVIAHLVEAHTLEASAIALAPMLPMTAAILPNDLFTRIRNWFMRWSHPINVLRMRVWIYAKADRAFPLYLRVFRKLDHWLFLSRHKWHWSPARRKLSHKLWWITRDLRLDAKTVWWNVTNVVNRMYIRRQDYRESRQKMPLYLRVFDTYVNFRSDVRWFYGEYRWHVSGECGRNCNRRKALKHTLISAMYTTKFGRALLRIARAWEVDVERVREYLTSESFSTTLHGISRVVIAFGALTCYLISMLTLLAATRTPMGHVRDQFGYISLGAFLSGSVMVWMFLGDYFRTYTVTEYSRSGQLMRRYVYNTQFAADIKFDQLTKLGRAVQYEVD